MFADLLYRLRAIFRKQKLDADLDDELRLHIECETEKYVRAGLSPDEAKRRARLALGGFQQVTEETRSVRGISALTDLSQDIRHGLRVLRKSPALTAVAITSLALGIGANLVVFGVINALILRPLPLPEPDRLVFVQRPNASTYSFPNYRDLRDRNDAFSGLAAYRITVIGLETGGMSQRVWGYLATGNYFEVLGAKPYLGRYFSPAEDRDRGGSPYAVISYASWQTRFGGDAGIVGRTIRLNGRSYTVLGVTPKEFHGTELFYWPEIWVPMSMQAQIESFSWLDERGTYNSMVVGRLKPDITASEAEARLVPVAAALAKEHPGHNEGIQFKLARPGLVGDTLRRPVFAFTAGVLLLASLVLLAACANLASLLAARTADRQKELAMRISLGASRARIARQLLTESVLLACGGGLAACALSVLLLRLLSQWRAPLDFPVQFNVEPDWRVFLFAFAASLVSAILFGLAPAQRAWRTDPNSALKSATSVAGRKWALRDVLLPIQVTLCCLLLMCGFVAMRGLLSTLKLPLGFEPSGVAVAGFDFGLSRYDKTRGRAAQRAVLDAALQIPGVTAAAFANSVPLSIDQSSNSVAPEDAADFRPSARIGATVYQVSPGYFRTIGTRLLNGRDFSWQDDEKAPIVAIINETLARKLFGATDAAGRRFRVGRTALVQVIGVVEDGKYTYLTEQPRPALFWPATQRYNGETVLLARTLAPEGQIAAEMRRALGSIDPTVAVHGVGSLHQMLGFAYFPARAATIALAVFGFLGIMLAATGIYGMAAYAISRRSREIGIRTAIGAQRRHILNAVLGRTFLLLLIGSMAGLLLGFSVAGPLLANIVSQASPRDPLVMATVPLAMALIGIFAALGPARRAMKIDPVFLLRQE